MFVTNDLATASFLMIRGCRLHNAYINEKKIFVFEFVGEEQEIRQIAIEYLNSECVLFDTQLKNLKKILKSGYK